MNPLYDRLAGRSLERLAALSDGVFAIAMTLLVLDLHVPEATSVPGGEAGAQVFSVNWANEGALWTALAPLVPRIIPYFMSFLTLGIFWVAQHTQFTHFARSNRDLAWIHLGFLLAVSLIPFSTALLAEFITYRLALIVYWLNILLMGVALFISRRYAARAGLMRDEVTPDMRTALEGRIIFAQGLYAVGALLCVVSTYLSIAVIVLGQLYFAFAPRLRR